jgi:hypothetical protein
MAKLKKVDAPTEKGQESSTLAPVVTQTSTPVDGVTGQAEAQTSTNTELPASESKGEQIADAEQVKAPEEVGFVLRVRNTGRPRLEQLTGTLLKQGEVTKVTLKSQSEYDHVVNTLRQFNELAGRKCLVILEGDE